MDNFPSTIEYNMYSGRDASASLGDMYVPSIFNKDHIYMSGFESACSHHCTLAVYGSSTDDFANLLQMEA